MPASTLARSRANSAAISAYSRLRSGTGASVCGLRRALSRSRSRTACDNRRMTMACPIYQATRGSWLAPYAKRVANWETGVAMGFSRNSNAELAGQILHAARRDIDRRLRSGFAGPRPALVRSGDVARAQPAFGGGEKIVGMRGDHHAFAGRQVERLAGGEIDARLGLVVARGLGAQDRVPGKTVAAGEVDHQRDIAVGDRRQHVFALEPREARCGIGPAVEAMPSEIEVARRVLGQIRKIKARPDAVEIVPMQ